MAKECIDYCPRIKSILRRIEDDNFWAGPLAIHPNIRGSEDLLRACRNSYDCSGPRWEEVQQTIGILRKRIETKRQLACGLEPTK